MKRDHEKSEEKTLLDAHQWLAEYLDEEDLELARTEGSATILQRGQAGPGAFNAKNSIHVKIK